ncbi:MAG TPA: hypothetical protein VJ969_08170 [Desulfopila sp.]|nr:hypothetical protein [Desulfopila sp.]
MAKKKPSYTHNADETGPVTPHLSDKNKPGHSGQGQQCGAATAGDDFTL